MLPSNALRAIATAELFALLSILLCWVPADVCWQWWQAMPTRAAAYIFLVAVFWSKRSRRPPSAPAQVRLRISADTHASYNSRTLSVALQMERRERLRKILAEREAAGEGALEGAPLIGQVWCACMKACAVVHYTCLAMPFKHVLSVTLTAACRHRMRRYMPAR